MSLATRPASDQALASMAAAIEGLATRVTDLAGLTRGLMLNNVIRSELVVLDDDGRAAVNSSVPFASVGIVCFDDAVTVNAGTLQEDVPTAGIGVIPLPGAAAIVWPLTGSTLSLYGTAGDRVLVTIWEKPQCPMYAPGYANVDGGGA